MSEATDSIKLKRTTAFRLSMVYAISFWLLSLAALFLAYQHTIKEVNKQINAGLRGEALSLQATAEQLTLDDLTSVIAARSTQKSLLGSDWGDAGPRFYLLVDKQGHYLTGSMPHWRQVLHKQGDSTLNTLVVKTPGAIKDLVESRDEFHLRSYQLVLSNGARLLVGQALNELAEMRGELLLLITAIIVLMISAGIGGGWWIGRTVVRSLNNVIEAADQIMAGDLSQRITTTRQTDEFALLARRLNLMLARIENLMAELHEVTENVAHDLRTPLTRLRTHAEIALSQTHEEQAREALQTVIKESEALVRMLEAIMGIAQVESGKRGQWQRLDLSQVCADVIDFYEPLAEDAKIRLSGHIPDSPLHMEGNAQLIAQAIGNLVDNAIKYTPAGGQIGLTLNADDKQAQLTLTDTGPGIPAELRNKALQRFVRLDNSRSKPGNGLGLAMVAAIVKQHNGELQFDDASPGRQPPGLRARIRFPLT